MITNSFTTGLPDPRQFRAAAAAPARDAAIFALATESAAAATAAEAQATDERLRTLLAPGLAGDGDWLAELRDGAPSVDVARHVWRQIERLSATAHPADSLHATLFALPLVIVAGGDAAGAGDGALPGVVNAVDAIADLLREHGALGGNRTFAFANVLATAEAVDLRRLPLLLAWERLAEAGEPDAAPLRELVPQPLPLATGREAVYLRFLLGTALAAPGRELFRDESVGGWGAPLTRLLARELGVPGATVLALPRAPMRPLTAQVQGRAAQREVSAQLFASNAIRKLRASVGEPSAVLSAHRVAGVPGGGELRLSLSSPFETREAEGFRCPLYPLDRVSDVAGMLLRLLADCRVTDVHVLDGIHADRVPGTTHPLLFKPETIPGGAPVSLQ